MDHPVEPTGEQCNVNAAVDTPLGTGWAIWYPQMGGYTGRAVAYMPDPDACAEVWVWHDGDFPFGDGPNPRLIHHCDMEQFVRFGTTMQVLADRTAQGG